MLYSWVVMLIRNLFLFATLKKNHEKEIFQPESVLCVGAHVAKSSLRKLASAPGTLALVSFRLQRCFNSSVLKD
jgi:hypothetical protein